MTDISSSEIPKPQNWQDFQRACVPLFRSLIEDPQLQEWGREGQDQQGIDLFGYRERDPKRPVGIQCKRIAEPITEKTLRKEVAKAKDFKPLLTELIFATTSDRDAKIQSVAAQITGDLHDAGWNCRITVMGWQDLQSEIARSPEALNAFLPTGRVFDQQVIRVVRETEVGIHSKLDATAALLVEKIEQMSRSHTVARDEYDSELDSDAQGEPAGLHAEITTYRNFIRRGQTKIALQELTRLLGRSPPPYARFRILSSISAIHLNAGRTERALDYSKSALAIRPNDVKARTNLAFAELINGDRMSAAGRAAEILKEHPGHGPAASALLQSRADDKTVSNPFLLVPDASHGTADFAVGAIVFLRHHDDTSWHHMAAEAATKYPASDVLKRFAAEAELEPILKNAETLLGKDVDPAVSATVIRCAAVLRTVWEKEISSDDVVSDEVVPLAANLASAYRFAGDDTASADVLDKTMAKAGRDHDLVRFRALLHLHADEDSKAVDLLSNSNDDPEALLFVAQVLAHREPTRSLEYIDLLDPQKLPEHLRHVIAEVRAELAIGKRDAEGLITALTQHEKSAGPFAIRALFKSRGQELGILQISEEAPDAGKSEKSLDDADDETALPPHVKRLVDGVKEHEDELVFSDRVQLAQYLNNHDAYDIASDLLADRVHLGQDTVALRTYLTACVGAHLTVRSQSVLDALPADVIAKPFFQRVAAAHYWNSGDAKSAAPFIEATYLNAPKKLQYFLWYLDSLLREGRTEKIRELLEPAVEEILDGTLDERSRLVRALAEFGQKRRALKFAYRGFALNRDAPSTWIDLMSVMLPEEGLEDFNLLSPVIGPDHTFEVEFDDGSRRRYLIEADESVRNVEPGALPPQHAIATAVQGHAPGDKLRWPIDDREAKIVDAKHKYLDALHLAMLRFNERFPNAKGFRQLRIDEGASDPLSELKAEVVARAKYVSSRAAQYSDGKFSLAMLGHLTGADEIDAMLGLREAGAFYRVSIGLAQERLAAFEAIAANNVAGCVVDPATYHCIRRLELEVPVQLVCGPICITQSTADLYQIRLQSASQQKPGGGSLSFRNGTFYRSEFSQEQAEKTRTTIASDIAWLKENSVILPARPVADPPEAFRRLGSTSGAHFFDEIYAASGSRRILLVDDLFTRQVAAMLGTPATWLQPVLMIARDREIISVSDYVKAITDLADIGQEFISVDLPTLVLARELDRDAGAEGVGRRFGAVARAIGGKRADPISHSSVVADFFNTLWSRKNLPLGDYEVTSHLLRELTKGRTRDFRIILDFLDNRLARRNAFRIYLRQWARGHFLDWPLLTSSRHAKADTT